MEVQSILSVFLVIFGLSAALLNSRQMDLKVVTSGVNEEGTIRKNFRSLLDSIAKNDTIKTDTYHNILEVEAKRVQQAFDTMREELQFMRPRNAYRKSKFYENISAFKREIHENGNGSKLEETTLDQYIIAAAKRRSNNLTLVDASSKEKLMSEEYLRKSYNLAAELQALGCDKDTVVGLVSENHLEYPVVILGTVLTGAVLTCFNPAYTTDELKPVYNIAKPSIVFCSPENYVKVKQVVPSSTVIIVFGSTETSDAPAGVLKFSKLTRSSSKTRREVENKPEDVVFILYSSGTTGLPKGVMLTHKNMVFMMKIVVDEQLIETRGSTAVNVTPMFHCYGLHNLLSAIARDQTLVIMPKYDEQLYLSSIQKYEIQHLSLVPTLVTYLLKDPKVDAYNLSSIEAVTCGGAPLKEETEREFKRKFRLRYVQQGYGSTECTMINTIKHRHNTKPGTCGSAVPGSQIKIVDVQTGRTVGKNEVGEICVRGPHIMRGYYGNANATSETLDEEGWFHTGDVGYYDDDGDFFIVDRVKELIKYKSFQVAPAELEALLLTHPAVLDCGVVGIPDEDAGELPRAYVVKRDGFEVTETELIQYIAGKVSSQKRLRGGVEFVPRIPKNPSGKILRRKLRELWTGKRKSES